MIQPMSTVTCSIAASQMSAVWARLTTFLLRAHHAFLHTYHSAAQVDIDIFDQHRQCLIRCTIEMVDAGVSVSAPRVSAAPGTLAMDLLSLLQDLASEPHGEDDNEREQGNNEVGDHLHTLAHPLHDIGIIRIDAGIHTGQTKCHAKELHGHQEQHEKYGG